MSFHLPGRRTRTISSGKAGSHSSFVFSHTVSDRCTFSSPIFHLLHLLSPTAISSLHRLFNISTPLNSLALCLTDTDTILSQAMAKEFKISLAMHNSNGTCMQASTARYDSCSAEKIAGQNTAFHQKNAIVHAARLRFCCKKPDVSPVAIGRQIRFTGTTITARKSVPGTRLLAPHLTCTNTTIPYSSSLPLI